MGHVSTHVLDLSRGRPADGVSVFLEKKSEGGQFQLVSASVTDGDGRARDLLGPSVELSPGDYRVKFETGAYFRARAVETFYPEVLITFSVKDAAQSYHVPLLLSPFGYSTYRGS